jgi:hypothetical protein
MWTHEEITNDWNYDATSLLILDFGYVEGLSCDALSFITAIFWSCSCLLPVIHIQHNTCSHSLTHSYTQSLKLYSAIWVFQIWCCEHACTSGLAKTAAAPVQHHVVKTLHKHRCWKCLCHSSVVLVRLHVRLLWEDIGGEQMGRHRWMTAGSSLVGVPSHLLLDNMCAHYPRYWTDVGDSNVPHSTIQCSLVLQPPDTMSTFIHTHLNETFLVLILWG